MARRRTVSKPLALAVLAYLMERPMHPYELGKLLKQRDALQSISYKHASLYMVVDQLRRDGFIAPQETVRDGHRPERTVYRLTEAGSVELRERMRELVGTPATEPRSFEAALSLIVVLPPAEVAELLGEREQALAEQAEQVRAHLRQAGPEVDRLFLIEHDYRLSLLEAELDFVRRFAELIKQGGADFGRFWRQLHGG